MWFPPVKTRIQAVRAETDKNRKGAATVIYGYVCKPLIAPPRIGGRACGTTPTTHGLPIRMALPTLTTSTIGSACRRFPRFFHPVNE